MTPTNDQARQHPEDRGLHALLTGWGHDDATAADIIRKLDARLDALPAVPLSLERLEDVACGLVMDLHHEAVVEQQRRRA